MKLTTEKKAEMFDYLATILVEAKIRTKFGDGNPILHEHGTPEKLA